MQEVLSVVPQEGIYLAMRALLSPGNADARVQSAEESILNRALRQAMRSYAWPRPTSPYTRSRSPSVPCLYQRPPPSRTNLRVCASCLHGALRPTRVQSGAVVSGGRRRHAALRRRRPRTGVPLACLPRRLRLVGARPFGGCWCPQLLLPAARLAAHAACDRQRAEQPDRLVTVARRVAAVRSNDGWAGAVPRAGLAIGPVPYRGGVL